MRGRVRALAGAAALALAAPAAAQQAAPPPQEPPAAQPPQALPPPAPPPPPANPPPASPPSAAVPPSASPPPPADPGAAGVVPGGATAGAPARSGRDPDPDAERAARALERSLVERGGLLLPPGRFELVPEIGYAHSDTEAILGEDGTLLPAEARRFSGSITLRLGLPLRLQAEGELPIVHARLTPQGESGPLPTATATGIGDFRLGLTWHAIRSPRLGLDLLLSGFYKARSGQTPLDEAGVRVPLGTGIEQLGGGLAIVKAVDPVVLLLSASLGESVPRRLAAGWLDPGLELEITTAVLLAVSPETSLSFGLDQGYSQRARLAGRALPGTERTAATFTVGFATLASRYGLVELSLGMGLTRDVPQFQVGLATPLQF